MSIKTRIFSNLFGFIYLMYKKKADKVVENT